MRQTIQVSKANVRVGDTWRNERALLVATEDRKNKVLQVNSENCQIYLDVKDVASVLKKIGVEL
jgi:hypothetical protein